jgi:hypothetical protein
LIGRALIVVEYDVTNCEHIVPEVIRIEGVEWRRKYTGDDKISCIRISS